MRTASFLSERRDNGVEQAFRPALKLQKRSTLAAEVPSCDNLRRAGRVLPVHSVVQQDFKEEACNLVDFKELSFGKHLPVKTYVNSVVTPP
jgi:hypothetical protein